jgi:hypothetical protein
MPQPVHLSPNEPGPNDSTLLVNELNRPSRNASSDPATQLYGPTRKPERPSVTDGMDDPVVGWLAIVEGPGKGCFARLGYGMNSIGRGPEDRVTLDYGDDQMSRNKHAIITYDPKSRSFYVQHGGGVNLTYLGDDPVLTPTKLNGGELINIGQTILKFVRLCGEDFDWKAS